MADGRTNAVDSATTRRPVQILRANVLTPFNGLLVSLLVVILITGKWQNGLFGFVILANSAIGVIQEVRAKRLLDRLAVLNAPRAHVVRDGRVEEVESAAIVLDDLLELRAGDQIPVDGAVVSSAGLEVDESLLTGESEPIAKRAGDDVRSAAIVVGGSGRFVATAVGEQAYAAKLGAQARTFTLVQSELVHATNRLLRGISLMMLVVGPLLLWSQFRSADNPRWQDAVTGTVAALVGMVPEGLVLLTSIAFFLAAFSLARRQTLVQELAAVEVLARVDVVCLDKTGTLTHGDIEFDSLIVLPGCDASSVHGALALSASAGHTNATTAALAPHFTGDWRSTGEVAFSSARKWSAVAADGHGVWVVGAPEVLLSAVSDDRVRRQAEEISAAGRRVLLLCEAPGDLDDQDLHDPVLPSHLTPRALVVFAERIREDAAETLRYFTEQGVALKVISGDSPRTVGAIAAAAGVPGVSGPDDALDARTLPAGTASDEAELDAMRAALAAAHAFGRVTPHQKRALIRALQADGHVVAMTGDGVNDALALKDADIGIAMGTGSAAARGVAQLVLLDGRFSHLPDVVAEGRRVIANIERAASLFLVKNVYSLVLALIVVVTAAAYPLAPIQLSLISNVTIGIPAFFLALGPNRRRYVPGFLGRVLRFSIPVGVVIGAAAFTGYAVFRSLDPAAGVTGGRTVATLAVLICSLWTLLTVARPLAGWKVGLVTVMAAVVAGIVLIPPLATGVYLLHPTPTRVLAAVITGAAGAVLVEITRRWVARATPG